MAKETDWENLRLHVWAWFPYKCRTKNVVSMGIMTKKCSKCLRFNRLGDRVPKPHVFTVKWEGSSGAIKSALALKLIQYVNKLHNGLLNVTEIVTDDDSTMHDHCKHKNRGGKLTNNIPEPIFRTNSSNCIKVMCKPIFVMVSNTKNPDRCKDIEVMRIKRYTTYYVMQNRCEDLDSLSRMPTHLLSISLTITIGLIVVDYGQRTYSRRRFNC